MDFSFQTSAKECRLLGETKHNKLGPHHPRSFGSKPSVVTVRGGAPNDQNFFSGRGRNPPDDLDNFEPVFVSVRRVKSSRIRSKKIEPLFYVKIIIADKRKCAHVGGARAFHFGALV